MVQERNMKAIITSVGEVTLEVCEWAANRNGFDVEIINDPKTTLWQKLKDIYDSNDEDFIRIDADTIINRNCTPKAIEKAKAERPEVWWLQFLTFDWYKQDLTHGGIQFVRKQALPTLRKRISDFKSIDRPETQLSRVEEFYNPRRFETYELVVGITNYRQNMKEVAKVKQARGQIDNYDWELASRIKDL
jgi:hypothetical protein